MANIPTDGSVCMALNALYDSIRLDMLPYSPTRCQMGLTDLDGSIRINAVFMALYGI